MLFSKVSVVCPGALRTLEPVDCIAVAENASGLRLWQEHMHYPGPAV
jgi:hypothetical protein